MNDVLNKEYELSFENKINLKDTIESGQTFLWNVKDGEMFDGEVGDVYRTCRLYEDKTVGIEVEQISDDTVLVRTNRDEGYPLVSKILGRDKYDVSEVKSQILEKDTKDGIMKQAIESSPGLRIVQEPLFPTLISFICSTQMRVQRIHKMTQNISEKYGRSLDLSDGETYAFPTPDELREATEKELKDIGLGYRARYVEESAEMYHESTPELSSKNSEARDQIQEFMGAGVKVADCTLLYGDSRLDVVPVDTWIDSAVDQNYPELRGNSREETARNFERFFGDYAGFAQAYMFHYMRTEN